MVLFVSSTFEKGIRSFTLALRSLWLHKMRAFLSVLGIIIGTAAVIALMAFGEGSMQDALEDIKRQGATNIIVQSVKPPEDGSAQRSFVVSYGLTRTDYDYLTTLPTIARHVPLRVFKQDVRYLGRTYTGRVVGTTPRYADVHKFDVVSGRFLTDDEEENMENNAVLGSHLAATLFPFDDPVGQAVVIGKNHYRIVGVLGWRMPTGGSGGSQAAEEFNDDIYIPLSTCNVRFGERVFVRQPGSRMGVGERVELHQITMTVDGMERVRTTGNIIRNWLERTHGRKRDWTVTVPLDRLEEAERARDRGTMLLVMIASISLVVGGIGIMNIMLATVTERTREIGIRRALGAKRRDITMQFLIEAMVQTTIGGVLGVLLGLGVVATLPLLVHAAGWGNLPARIHVLSIFLALFVSVGVGVLFGWYPARRASLLDPIEALRHV